MPSSLRSILEPSLSSLREETPPLINIKIPHRPTHFMNNQRGRSRSLAPEPKPLPLVATRCFWLITGRGGAVRSGSACVLSCVRLCDPMGCGSPGSSVHGILWSGLPFTLPGDLPDPGIEPASLKSPALAFEFFTTSAIWEAQKREGRMQNEEPQCGEPHICFKQFTFLLI